MGIGKNIHISAVNLNLLSKLHKVKAKLQADNKLHCITCQRIYTSVHPVLITVLPSRKGSLLSCSFTLIYRFYENGSPTYKVATSGSWRSIFWGVRQTNHPPHTHTHTPFGRSNPHHPPSLALLPTSLTCTPSRSRAA